eukprot:scaffold275264_cov39-Tisochrysis_lutea.AAC.1
MCGMRARLHGVFACQAIYGHGVADVPQACCMRMRPAHVPSSRPHQTLKLGDRSPLHPLSTHSQRVPHNLGTYGVSPGPRKIAIKDSTTTTAPRIHRIHRNIALRRGSLLIRDGPPHGR